MKEVEKNKREGEDEGGGGVGRELLLVAFFTFHVLPQSL